VKYGDRSQCHVEVSSAAPVVAQHAPGLELREPMLDPSSSPSVSPPCTISDDATSAKYRRDKLWHSAIAAVREDATVSPAQTLDRRPAVMNHRCDCRVHLPTWR
jgi:hypothetical protein